MMQNLRRIHIFSSISSCYIFDWMTQFIYTAFAAARAALHRLCEEVV